MGVIPVGAREDAVVVKVESPKSERRARGGVPLVTRMLDCNPVKVVINSGETNERMQRGHYELTPFMPP